jgi:hypothetical protein
MSLGRVTSKSSGASGGATVKVVSCGGVDGALGDRATDKGGGCSDIRVRRDVVAGDSAHERRHGGDRGAARGGRDGGGGAVSVSAVHVMRARVMVCVYNKRTIIHNGGTAGWWRGWRLHTMVGEGIRSSRMAKFSRSFHKLPSTTFPGK